MRLYQLVIFMLLALVIGIIVLVTKVVDEPACNTVVDEHCVTENGARYNQ